MFHVAFSRGQRPAYADLPPTLQPCAIASSAPRPDHARAAALSGLVYLLLGGAAVAFASLTPAVVVVPSPPVPPERIVVFDSPTLPRFIERVISRPGGSGGANSTAEAKAMIPQVDPQVPAPGLSREDHSKDSVPTSVPTGHPLPPTTLPPGTGTGTGVVHDFSMVGLAVLQQVDPVYPEFARRAHIQGAVVLKMTVDERGQPTQVEVMEGHPVFHEAAQRAARQWRFEPARLDGQPVKATFHLTLKFSLR